MIKSFVGFEFSSRRSVFVVVQPGKVTRGGEGVRQKEVKCVEVVRVCLREEKKKTVLSGLIFLSYLTGNSVDDRANKHARRDQGGNGRAVVSRRDPPKDSCC